MGGNYSGVKPFEDEDEAIKYLTEQHQAATSAGLGLVSVQVSRNNETGKFEYQSYYEC